jgi:UDP-hydrolysing UDP-N-acetyl-D-glucosamine 2-epimerase
MHVIDAVYEKDSKESMAAFTGDCIARLSRKVSEIRPDFILLLGDRGEMLAGAVAGAYMSIPVAHIHGGEISSTVDDHVRNAITMLASVHFPATRRSAERIVAMGEDPDRVFPAGAPGLDVIFDQPPVMPEEIGRRYGQDLQRPFVLVVQHAVTMESDAAAGQIRETLEAIVGLGLPAIVVYPNADAGGREMIGVIREYERYPGIRAFRNIPHRDFISLMRMAGVMVGNSSSGIVEAPALRLPAVNVGSRQRGREAAENVINAGYDRDEIARAIRTTMNDRLFRAKVDRCVSPYGNGGAGRKIADVLSTIVIDRDLLQKRRGRDVP